MIEDAADIRQIRHQQPQEDDNAYFDYDQRRNRASVELDSKEFRLNLRSSNGSPLNSKNAKHRSEYAQRSTVYPHENKRFTVDDLIPRNDEMLIS